MQDKIRDLWKGMTSLFITGHIFLLCMPQDFTLDDGHGKPHPCSGTSCECSSHGEMFPISPYLPLPSCIFGVKVKVKVKVKSLSRVRLFVTPHRLQPTRLLHPWDFPGKSTGVGCHFLLKGIFASQGLNPGLPHCRQMLLPSEPGKSSIFGVST